MLQIPGEIEDDPKFSVANDLRDKFIPLFDNFKIKGGNKTQLRVANLIGEDPNTISECHKSIRDQRINKNRSFDYIIKRYNKVISKLEQKIAELEQNKNSPPLKPFDKPLRWVILLAVPIIMIILWSFGITKKFGSEVNTREVSILSLIAVVINIMIIIFLIVLFFLHKLKKFPDTDAGKGAKIFQIFWIYSLFSWLAMYAVLILYNSLLLNLPHQPSDQNHFWHPVKITVDKMLIVLSWVANIMSAFNSAFLYMCFLVLATNIPLNRNNIRIHVRFHYFLIILSILLLFALLDDMLQDNVLFNGLSMTLFLTFMAATFILLVAKLESPLFKSNIRIFHSGAIYFYGATMPIYAIAQSGKTTIVSVVALAIFGIGKIVFGLVVHERIKASEAKDSCEIISYLETYYKR